MMKKFFWAALCWATIGVGLAAPLAADIGLSLAYVDMGGPAYLRFKTWVDQAVAGFAKRGGRGSALAGVR